MTNYVIALTGGGMPDTQEEMAKVMAAWGVWYEDMGEAIVDMGAPFGVSTQIATDRSTSDGAASSLTGYLIVKADSLAGGVELAKGCPNLDSGGSVEVYEALPVPEM